MLSQDFNPDVLEKMHKELLEAEIVALISERLGVEPHVAMQLYYNSKLSTQIDKGLYGIHYMDAAYLVDDLLDNEHQLFA